MDSRVRDEKGEGRSGLAAAPGAEDMCTVFVKRINTLRVRLTLRRRKTY